MTLMPGGVKNRKYNDSIIAIDEKKPVGKPAR